MSRKDHPPHLRRKGMRVTVWTILAPLALAAIVIATFNIVRDSDVLDKAARDKGKEESATQEPAVVKDVPQSVKLKTGETLEVIATRYGLTVEQILEYNPSIDDPQELQVGQFILLHPPQDAAKKKSSAPTADTAPEPAETYGDADIEQ